MAGGETARITEIAERLSNEIFNFFKWKTLPVGLMNQNFDCVHKEEHVVLKEKQIENLKAEFDQKLIEAKKTATKDEEWQALS